MTGVATVTWAEAFGLHRVEASLTAHAAATAQPVTVAGVQVASRVAAALGRAQARSLAEHHVALHVHPGDLRISREGGELAATVVVPGSASSSRTPSEVDREQEYVVAGRSIDEMVDALVDACARGGSRTPARVVASAALFGWYAVLRQRGSSTGRSPAEVLAEQWRSRWKLDSLVRRFQVPTDTGERTYLARAACCLDYRSDDPAERSFCASCPMVDPARLLAHLNGGRSAPAGRRPFTHADLRRAGSMS